MQIIHIMNTFHSDHPIRHTTAIVKTEADLTHHKKVTHNIHYTDPTDRAGIFQIIRAHPREDIHQIITAHVCSINMYVCVVHADRADPTQ